MANVTLDNQYYRSLRPIPYLTSLTTDGLATGVFVATGDYSLAAEDFFTVGPAGRLVVARTLRFVISDAGNPGRDDYGNILGLINGICIFFKRANKPEQEVTVGLRPIKTNEDFERVVGVGGSSVVDYAGSTSRVYDVPFIDGLEIAEGDQLTVRLHDDFTGLADHQFSIIGTVHGRIPL